MKTLMENIEHWTKECFPNEVSNTRINPSGEILKLFFKETVHMDVFSKVFNQQNEYKNYRLSRANYTIEVHLKDENDDIDWVEGKTYHNNNDLRGYKLNEVKGNYYYFTIFAGSSSNLVVTYHDNLKNTWSEDYENAIKTNIANQERSIESTRKRLERSEKDVS